MRTKSWTGYLCQMSIFLKRKCHHFHLGKCLHKCPHFSHSIIYLHLFTPAKKQIKQKRRDKSKGEKMWMLDALSQFKSCFCLPKHISEDIQVSFTQLHWLLCPLKMSPWCLLHTECKRNQMWFSENRLFSVIMFHFPLFLWNIILV